jgi:hypothetical protein
MWFLVFGVGFLKIKPKAQNQKPNTQFKVNNWLTPAFFCYEKQRWFPGERLKRQFSFRVNSVVVAGFFQILPKPKIAFHSPSEPSFSFDLPLAPIRLNKTGASQLFTSSGFGFSVFGF